MIRGAAGLLALLVVLGASAASARADDASMLIPPGPDLCASVGTESEPGAPPVVWTAWAVEPAAGTHFLESPETVKALFEDVMVTRQALTPSAQCDLADVAGRFGYQLTAIRLERPTDKPGVVRAVLVLAPRTVVRRVHIHVVQWWRLSLQDELERRMRLRVGEELDADPDRLSVQLDDEKRRLTQYLQDQGYFEAEVTLGHEPSDDYGAILEVHVDLGPGYQTGAIKIAPARQLAFTRDEIVRVFDHCRLRLFGKCRWRPLFNRSQHQADIQALIAMYQKRGYPAARVRSDYDTQTSFDRRTHTVGFTLRIDERRKLVVEFEGNKHADGNSDPGFSDDDLAKQLTFDDAGSSDDLEVASSALALQRYYQRAGYFDAAVGSSRERKEAGTGDQSFDLIRFQIDQGPLRTVRAVEIVGARAVPEDDLRAVLVTKAAGASFSLIGGEATVTREQLDADVARVLALYHQRGYLEATVRASASPVQSALDDAASTAAVLGAAEHPTDLYVRFTVVEGEETVLEHVAIDWKGAHTASDAEVAAKLAIPDGSPYQLTALQAAGQRLQDWFGHIGRPRAQVKLDVASRDPHHVTATFHIEEREEVRIGEVVVRGNFRTREWVVLDQLGFTKGAVLTDDLYARGVARLRATGLFSTVRVETPELDTTRSPDTDVVVHVEERNDVKFLADMEAGYSDLKSFYFSAAPTLPNPLHNGISFGLSGTLGVKFNSVDLSIKIPRWVTKRYFLPIAPDVEVSAFARSQDTDRFGQLNSYGLTLAASRVWQRAADGHDARSIAATVHYDARLRNIQEDAVRIAGNAGGVTQAALGNRASSIGIDVTWDQRVDPHGNLNPLTPDHGFKLEAGASVASRLLGGQDDFIKVEGIGQWITQLSSRLQLKLEGRFDQGIPLFGAVLLPEVERFFAGGDDTVRGFPQDRLATEDVVLPVPPFGNIEQVTVLPAGGNIRLIGSIDLETKLWRIGSIPIASAIFVDAGAITNTWQALDHRDVRPSIGVALPRILTPFGGLSFEWAIPMFPRDVDPPLGRYHIIIALRY